MATLTLALRTNYIYRRLIDPKFGSPAFALVLVAAIASIGCGFTPRASEAGYLASGQKYLEKHRYPEAILQFKNAAKLMPKDPEPHYQAGLAYLGQGDVREAVNRFQAALQLNPKHQGAQLRLAELMAATEDGGLVAKAAESLRDLLKTSPANPDILDTLAFAELQLGSTADSEKHLKESLANFPNRLRTSVVLARLRLSQKDLAGAEAVLKEAVQHAPESADAAIALGQIYRMTGKPELAAGELRRALAIDPKNGMALASLAALQLASNRSAEADDTYTKLASLPDSAYWPIHATFLLQQGKKDAAVAELEKLAKAHPDSHTVRIRLLATYVATGKLPEAEKLLAVALKENAKDADALFERGQLYLRTGKPALAEKDLREALRYRRESAPVHLALAEAYGLQGATLRRRQELDQALRENPSLLAARTELAQVLIAAKSPKAALEVMDETPAAQKNSVPAIEARNWALMGLGDGQEFQKGVELGLSLAKPPTPDLLLQKASLLIGLRDYAGALAWVEELIRQNPEDERAWRIVADSYRLQNQPGKALARLNAAIAQHPRSAVLHHVLGQWLLAKGERAGARDAFTTAVTLNPGYTQATLALAELDLSAGNTESARSALTRVLAASEYNTAARLMLAGIESQAGHGPAAVANYRAVVETDGSNLVALNNLAYLLAKDNPDDALRYAQLAAEYAPENPSIQDTLGWIYYRKGLFPMAVEHLKDAVHREGTPLRRFHLGMAYLKNGNKDIGQKTVEAALAADRTLRNRDW